MRTHKLAAIVFAAVVFTATFLFPAPRLTAAEPGWTRNAIKTPGERAYYRNIPVEQRPYRPLHFYGNAVRRRYYRGRTAPQRRDVTQTTRGLFRRR